MDGQVMGEMVMIPMEGHQVVIEGEVMEGQIMENHQVMEGMVINGMVMEEMPMENHDFIMDGMNMENHMVQGQHMEGMVMYYQMDGQMMEGHVEKRDAEYDYDGYNY